MNSNLFYTTYDQIDTVQNSNSDCNYLKLPGISGFNQLGIPVLLNDLKIMDESTLVPDNFCVYNFCLKLLNA